MQPKERIVLRGTTWKLDDVNELERELMMNIERMPGCQKVLKRIANLVGNQLGKIRALIYAERLLEDDGVEFIREER